jgi:hypothetical protein
MYKGVGIDMGLFLIILGSAWSLFCLLGIVAALSEGNVGTAIFGLVLSLPGWLSIKIGRQRLVKNQASQATVQVPGSAAVNSSPAPSPAGPSAAPAPDFSKTISVTCKGCGAASQVAPGRPGQCEFCGAPLTLPPPEAPAVSQPESAPTSAPPAQAESVPTPAPPAQAGPPAVDLEAILNICRSKLKDDHVFLAPIIPRPKAEGAIQGYAGGLEYADIVALVDDTLFGKADDGMIVSRKGLFAHELGEPIQYMAGSALKTVTSSGGKLVVNGSVFTSVTLPDAKSMAAVAELIAAMFGLPHPSQVRR